MRRLVFLLPFLLILTACASYKGRVEGGRYFSPNGEFSIALPDNLFKPVVDTVYPGQSFVDFTWQGSKTAYGIFGLKTVEWIALAKPATADDFAELSPPIAREHVQKRFSQAGANFTFHNGTLVRKDVRSEYHFFASGQLDGRHTAWEGVVVDMGDRLAFVSNVKSTAAEDFSSVNLAVMTSKISASLAAWQKTLRRES